MTGPIIGISAGSIIAEGGAGSEKLSVNEAYIKAICQTGGVPVILPTVSVKKTIEAQAGLLDGLLLSGGGDIHPLFYGEEPDTRLGFCDLRRDEYELALIQAAAGRHKPIFGICRGIQVLNVAFGGTLYQDISRIPGSCLQHTQQARRDTLFHTVIVEKATGLFDIVATESFRVNSFHHQAVKDPAPGFIVSGRTRDGVIEAIEQSGQEFVLGVQWHPEMLLQVRPEMRELFRRFVKKAAQSNRRSSIK
ncbi:MAG: gamma-glutamyl-gamma-aminobutyrate hydrolase family protein [Veillonellales bacterium]